MKEVKVALAMIVRGADEEAKILDRCLGGLTKEHFNNLPDHQKEIDFKGVDGLAKYVDGIFITITQPNEKVEEVAKKYGATISHYKWDHNFANARNFNFSQVPEEYGFIIWADSDDVVRKPELIKKLAKKAKAEGVDVIIANYLYDFDIYGQIIVQHLKTRFIKNDGCVIWVGDIHEDFAENRRVISYLNTEMAYIHLTSDSRVGHSVERNLDIAKASLMKAPNDPRSYWNLGNAYLMQGNNEQAIQVYHKFLVMSQAEEERYLVWHRLGEAYMKVGDYTRAIESELEALALRPWYPDPYFLLAEMYYNIDKYKHAQTFLEIGLEKAIPDTQAIVWNPRDYDYNPRMLLAKIYMAQFKPREAVEQIKKCLQIYPKSEDLKELLKKLEPEIKKFDYADKIYKKAVKIKDKKKLEKLLNKVDPEFKYYPPLVRLRNEHIIKEESSGKDVVIFCGYTVKIWDSVVAKEEGVGGSEEAVIQLSKRWKEAGYNVTIYANVGHAEKEIDGIKWIPFGAWNFRDKQDVTILWRSPKALDFGINSPIIFVDIHDVVPPQELTKERLEILTKVMFKSKVQRDFYPNVPDDKAAVIPHGLDLKQFEERAKVVEKNPYKIINTSSPDRGLLTNLEIIERVHKALPNELKSKLKFRWNYGFKVWDKEFENDEKKHAWKKKAEEKMDELKAKGIMEEESGDMISQDAVVDQYLESGLLLYPSEFFEIGFISGLKGGLAGAIPITTDVFAQGEFLHDGIIVKSSVNYEDWGDAKIEDGTDFGIQKESQRQFVVDEIVKYMKNPEEYEEMRTKIMDRIKNEFDWDKTAAKWMELFNE